MLSEQQNDVITVIVPIYKVEPYLRRCVESIQRQSYHKLEIILVDDGSPDGCARICEELKKSDERIKVIHKVNEGLGYARNAGLEMATGSYVAFIDSDDWISDTHIETLYHAATEYGAQMVMGSHTKVHTNGRIVNVKGFGQKLYTGEAIIHEILLPLIGPDEHHGDDVQIEGSACMNLYRMDLIRELNLRFINEKKIASEDIFFNVQYLYHAQRVLTVDEKGYFYFENVNSLSRKYEPRRTGKIIRYYSEIYDLIAKLGLLDRIGKRADRTFLLKVRTTMRSIVVSDLGYREKYAEIKRILDNDVVEHVLASYPVEQYPLAKRMLLKMMRSRNYSAVIFTLSVQELIKKSTLLKSVVKRIP